jgi:deoxyribonuclease-1
MKVSASAVALILCIFAAFSFAKVNPEAAPKHYNYRDAGKQMKRIYYGDLQRTLYCDCRYIDKKTVDFSSCNYKPRENEKRKSFKRAQRIEWEHIVTAHNMGQHLPCWRDGGRKNCSANDSTFKIMEGDLHNLYPAIGEVNGDRSNFMFNQWTNSPTPMYGECETIIDFEEKKVQPRKEVRGLIARVHFYMEKTYGINLSKQDRKLFEAWDRAYPVTERECERDRRIFKVQGDHNPFVFEKCQEPVTPADPAAPAEPAAPVDSLKANN